MNSSVNDLAFYGWANEQVLPCEGQLAEADIANIAEEIESIVRSEKREWVSWRAVLMTHLLKWRYQPAGRGSGWRASIVVQRRRLAEHLDDNPSLTLLISRASASAHGDARVVAGDETKRGETAFPETTPWSFDDGLVFRRRPDAP